LLSASSGKAAGNSWSNRFNTFMVAARKTFHPVTQCFSCEEFRPWRIQSHRFFVGWLFSR
jgi:hypothetical protein